MRWLKRLGYAVGALVVLAMLAAGAAYAGSEMKFRKTFATASEPPLVLAAVPDSVTLARGSHLATALGKCVECHGDHLGGKVFFDDPVMGRLIAPNLTRGGIGGALTNAQMEMAIRHGVGPNGRSLRIMPSEDYQWMSDADASALISYIRSLPSVSDSLPASDVHLLPRALMLAGKMPLLTTDVIATYPGKPMNMTPAPTREYGEYLAHVGGCMGCHGPQLSGGHVDKGPPDWPPAANLTPSGNLGKWTEADFVKTLKTGVRPDGYKLNPVMPWKLAAQMDSTEFHALWLYLQSVPKRDFGNH